MPDHVAVSDAAEPVYSRYAGDADFADLLRAFVAALPEKADRLRSAAEAARWNQLQIYAHQLKGSGGGYGFPGLSSLAGQLESACKAQAPREIATRLEALLDYLRRIRA